MADRVPAAHSCPVCHKHYQRWKWLEKHFGKDHPRVDAGILPPQPPATTPATTPKPRQQLPKKAAAPATKKRKVGYVLLARGSVGGNDNTRQAADIIEVVDLRTPSPPPQLPSPPSSMRSHPRWAVDNSRTPGPSSNVATRALSSSPDSDIDSDIDSDPPSPPIIPKVSHAAALAHISSLPAEAEGSGQSVQSDADNEDNDEIETDSQSADPFKEAALAKKKGHSQTTFRSNQGSRASTAATHFIDSDTPMVSHRPSTDSEELPAVRLNKGKGVKRRSPTPVSGNGQARKKQKNAPNVGANDDDKYGLWPISSWARFGTASSNAFGQSSFGPGVGSPFQVAGPSSRPAQTSAHSRPWPEQHAISPSSDGTPAPERIVEEFMTKASAATFRSTSDIPTLPRLTGPGQLPATQHSDHDVEFQQVVAQVTSAVAVPQDTPALATFQNSATTIADSTASQASTLSGPSNNSQHSLQHPGAPGTVARCDAIGCKPCHGFAHALHWLHSLPFFWRHCEHYESGESK